MNTETFFKILKQHFQKEEIKNFHGILITPVFDGELTVFKFENPNNVSFHEQIIRNYFYDECDMFGKIFGIDDREMYTKYVKHNTKSFSHSNLIYLNDSDKETLTNITKKYAKKFVINSSRYDVTLSADISVVGDVHLSSYDSESVGLDVDLKFENLKNPNKPSYDLNRNISVLSGWLYDDYKNYDEITHDLFRHTLNLIMDNPLLFDNSYMYVTANLAPIVYNEEGEMVDF